VAVNPPPKKSSEKKPYILIHFTQWKSTLVKRELSSVSQDLYYSGILIYDFVDVHYICTFELCLNSV
jgi:hypothetical protein